MKRSEAILQAALEFQKRSDAQQYPGYGHEELAEEFLSIYEELGMLPPYDHHTDDEENGNVWESETAPRSGAV